MNTRLTLVIILSAAAALFVSSCNTFIGAGRDMKRVGQGLENTGYGKKF